MINIAQKFALIREACVQLRGPEYCTDTVIQGVAAIARHETGFGTYKPFARPATSTEPAWNSYNWGAQQCGAKADKDGKCPDECFPAKDSSPVTGEYLGCFRIQPDEPAGALSLVRLVTVSRPGIAAALSSGDTLVIARAMHEARYYEGHGATVEERIVGYSKALARNAEINARQARVELLVREPPPPPPPPPPTGEEYGLLAALGIAALAAALKALLPPKTPVD